MSVSRGAGSAGVSFRAAFWQWMLTALLALVLAACGGDGVSLRAVQIVQVSGDVVAQDGATPYHITAYDQQGNRLGAWSTAADGHFQQALRGQPPFRLEAVSPENDVSLVMICEGQPIAQCDITPWSTLIYHVAEATGDSPQDVAASLHNASFFDLSEGEDPFLLHRADELEPLAFDIDAVLALMVTTEGLGDWLASMTDWLTGVSGATAPPGVPRVTVTAQSSAGGSVTPASQTLLRGETAFFTVQPAVGHHITQIDGCDGSHDVQAGTFTTQALTAPCALTVTFEIYLYPLTYTPGENGSLTGAASQTVAHGADASAVTAVPDTGYHFVQWSDGSVANPRQDLALSAELSVTATFAINQYALVYSAGAGGSLGGPPSQQVSHGSDGSAVTAIPDTGFHFVQWSDLSVQNPRTDLAVTQDLSVQAQFARNAYSLHYSAGAGGSLTGLTSQSVLYGDDGSAVSAQPDAGYHFVQWSDGSTVNPRTETAVTADVSVTATFAINQYNLVYAAGTHGSVTGDTSQIVNHGSDGSPVTAQADAGYYFMQWSDGSIVNPRTDVAVSGDIQVTAQFAIYQYSLSYAAGAGGTLSGVTTQTVDHGQDGTAVTAQADAGYDFVQWSDGSTANPRTDTGVTADLSVTAQFTLRQYSLVYTSQGNGTLQGQTSQTVDHGEDGTAITAVPDAGYDFVYWSDGGTANPRTDVNVTSGIAVSATFALRQYALTYGPGVGGSITGDIAQEVGHGSDGTAVTATPDTGYHFVQWSDGSTTNPRTDTSVTADISVLAAFALDEFALTYTAGPGGSLSGTASQVVVYGGDGTAVEAVPDTGYYFTNWSDGGLANPRTDTNVMADLSAQASFNLYQYTLSYTAGTGGSLSGSASQTVDHGSDGTAVQAVPDTGYHFVQWSDGSTANPRTESSATGDLSVQAQFAINEYTLTYTASAGGSLSGLSTQTVSHGAGGTAVTATPDVGYHFVAWSDNSTANPRTDTNVTADISVTAQFAADALELTLNEKHFASLQTGEVTVRNTGTEAATYVLVPMNLTPNADTLPVSVAVTNGVDAPTITTLSTGTGNGLLNVREPQKADALARLGTAGAGTPLPVGAGIPPGVPTVGDILQMNVNLTDTCDGAVLRDAEVKMVGTHVIILEDVDNPAGGFPLDNAPNDHDYTEIVSTFDTSVYPAVTALLGDVPDRDSNGRVILFFTRAMNELDPPASPAAVPEGRYMVRDRLSRGECPAGNVGEVIYMKVPDPTGAVNSNVRIAAFIRERAGLMAATEMALMIADDRHLQEDNLLPDTWLEKGLAGMAAGSVFYQSSYGLAPLQRITLANLTSGPNASRRVAAFNAYQNTSFGELRPWMQYPWRTGLMSTDERDTRSRGLTWAFLRYASDRLAIDSNDPPLVSVADGMSYQLAGTSVDGWASLASMASLVGADASDWLRDFLLTLYLDGTAPGSVPGYASVQPYLTDSWDFRSVYGGLGGYPLNEILLATGQGRSADLAGGGGAFYVRFSVAAGESVVLAMQAALLGGEDARYALVRLN